jgi:hypothetical protein
MNNYQLIYNPDDEKKKLIKMFEFLNEKYIQGCYDIPQIKKK